MGWKHQARGRQIGQRKASGGLLADRAADEELARTIIVQVLALEARGVLLPAGWRDKRPMTLCYLNSMLDLAIALQAAEHG